MNETIARFWGPEIRTEETAVLRNPYARFIGRFVNQGQTTSSLHELGAKVGACIVPDLECVAYVQPFFQRIYVLPCAMNAGLNVMTTDSPAAIEPLVAHAPVSTHYEGTSFVHEVMGRLRQEGFPFRAVIRQGLNQEERLDLFRQADIVIDQLLVGAYGPAAIDAMSLGKPTLSYIRSDQISDYPDVPVISANPATLYGRLAGLLTAHERRRELGMQGAEYVRRVHHPDRIASLLAWIYEREASMRSGKLEAEQGVIHNLYATGNDQPYTVAEERLDSSIRLYPNRVWKRRKGIYVSFNLAELPSDAHVAKAIMRIPGKKTTKPVSIYRITRGWDRKSVMRNKRPPRIAKKSIRKLSISGRKPNNRGRQPGQWICTQWAQHWQRQQLDNHGIYLSQYSSAAPPYLDVTMSR